MTVAVCSTLAAYKCDSLMESEAWLMRSNLWLDVKWFCALQVGHGHGHKVAHLRQRLDEIGATVWNYSLDDGESLINASTRLTYICMGRNLAMEWANLNDDIDHLLFLDSDTEPPPNLIEKLLEIDHPLVGAKVPTYCLDGPQIRDAGIPEGADVREQEFQTAGCLMLNRDAINSVRWGWSLDQHITDDPWTEQLAEKVGLGKVWVRHDVECKHHPQSIGPLEYRGHDLSIR